MGLQQAGTAKRQRRDHELWIQLMVMTAHRGLCVYCGRSRAHSLDHEQPVAGDGPDIWWNFMPACKPCNLWKSGRSARDWVVDMDMHDRQPKAFPGRAMQPVVHRGILGRVERTQREIRDFDRREWFRHHYGAEARPRNKHDLLRRVDACTDELRSYPHLPWQTPALPEYGQDVCTRRICCGNRHADGGSSDLFLNHADRTEFERLAYREGLHQGDLLGKLVRQYLVAQRGASPSS
ncbi:HNH endonuclease [Kitasatospora sp. NPDC003701]